MTNSENPAIAISSRNSLLLMKNFNRLLGARMAGNFCIAIASLVDSVIGSQFIGTNGVAAIQLFAPVLLLDEVLHCLFGAGSSLLYVRLCGRDEKKNADRAYTAILAATFIGYGFVCGLLLLFAQEYIAFYADTPELAEMTYAYYVPMVLSLPFLELGLISERVFSVDGRAFFFSLCDIVTIPLNIVLDILFVAHFSMGTKGLALATILSLAIGHLLSLSHIFSKKNTVRLSFDVFRNPRELFGFLKENFKIGSGYVLNGSLDMLSTAILNKFVLIIGGSTAIFALSLFSKISSIVCKISFAFSTCIPLFAGMLYGEEDYEGTTIILKGSFKTAILLGAVCTVLTLLLAEPFLQLCHVSDAATFAICMSALQISCLSFPGIALAQVFRTSLLVMENYSIFRIFCITLYPLQLSMMWFLQGIAGENAIWIALATANILTLLISVFIMKQRNQVFFPKPCDNVIESVSAVLNTETIGLLSVKAGEIIVNNGYSRSFANRISLLIEEAYSYILRKNTATREILTDMRIVATDKIIHISICENGDICNPLTDILNAEATVNGDTELLLLKGISDKYTYNRIADLNYTRIDCSIKEKQKNPSTQQPTS